MCFDQQTAKFVCCGCQQASFFFQCNTCIFIFVPAFDCSGQACGGSEGCCVRPAFMEWVQRIQIVCGCSSIKLAPNSAIFCHGLLKSTRGDDLDTCMLGEWQMIAVRIISIKHVQLVVIKGDCVNAVDWDGVNRNGSPGQTVADADVKLWWFQFAVGKILVVRALTV